MALWKLRQGRHKVKALVTRADQQRLSGPAPPYCRGSNCLRINSAFKENSTVQPASDTSLANNWFLPHHFLWPGSASKVKSNSSAQPSTAHCPWASTHSSLHTAYNNCHTSLPSVLKCLRLGPSAGLARMLPCTDLSFALLPIPFLCFSTFLNSLNFGKPVLLDSQASFSPLVWVPAVFQGSFHTGAFKYCLLTVLFRFTLVTSSGPSSPWGLITECSPFVWTISHWELNRCNIQVKAAGPCGTRASTVQ